MHHNDSTSQSRTIALAAGAAALIATVAVVWAVAPSAYSVAAQVLGATKHTPKPLCPKNCLATGTVTGLQVSADGKERPFTVKKEGHIVAWSVTLSKPSASQTADFNSKFASKRDDSSVARLAILKPQKKGRYKLVKQSPPVELGASFGRKPIFTLKKPLKVKPGLRIALTLPTWAPLYVNNLSASGDQWIASRSPKKCGVNELLDAKPHQKIGSTRKYGCRFTAERLLYKAYFVPKKNKK